MCRVLPAPPDLQGLKGLLAPKDLLAQLGRLGRKALKDRLARPERREPRVTPELPAPSALRDRKDRKA